MTARRFCFVLALCGCIGCASWDTGYITVQHGSGEHKLGTQHEMERVQGGYELTFRDGDYEVLLAMPRKLEDGQRYLLSGPRTRLRIRHPEFPGAEPIEFEDGSIRVFMWDPEPPPQVRATYEARYKIGNRTIEVRGEFWAYVDMW